MLSLDKFTQEIIVVSLSYSKLEIVIYCKKLRNREINIIPYCHWSC